ncbi:hypothetical protein NLJ89_g10805 [Agrocybe chaxingu]|uniref:Uncharacterized protein n=1 Tax=Agrocybe chaxingu TaxID=84603 RepID=A0A9W8JTK5_9AGAR|nr:hypothetical protein NLJ89_g10805 [Agrocybe chaxingu]
MSDSMSDVHPRSVAVLSSSDGENRCPIPMSISQGSEPRAKAHRRSSSAEPFDVTSQFKAIEKNFLKLGQEMTLQLSCAAISMEGAMQRQGAHLERQAAAVESIRQVQKEMREERELFRKKENELRKQEVETQKKRDELLAARVKSMDNLNATLSSFMKDYALKVVPMSVNN